MLFSVEHTNALDRAVVGNPLAQPPSTGRSNHLGGWLTALDRRHVKNLDSLLQEGPRQEQFKVRYGEPERGGVNGSR
jgi:hypothetical protein